MLRKWWLIDYTLSTSKHLRVQFYGLFDSLVELHHKTFSLSWTLSYAITVFNYSFISGDEFPSSLFPLTFQSCVLMCLFSLFLSLIPRSSSPSTHLLPQPPCRTKQHIFFQFREPFITPQQCTSHRAKDGWLEEDTAPLLRDFAVWWKTNMISTEKL